MSSVRGFMPFVLIAAIMLCGACGDPPEKEIDQAQGAIDAARAAGADQYAHEEFTAAQEALKHAHDAVGQRDYRLALNYALDSHTQAQNAAKNAADHKAKSRADAEHTLTETAAVLSAVRVKLKVAENAPHVPSKILADARRAVADGEEAVQKARAAVTQGDYAAVPDALGAPMAGLRAAVRELDSATGSGTHRRR